MVGTSTPDHGSPEVHVVEWGEGATKKEVVFAAALSGSAADAAAPGSFEAFATSGRMLPFMRRLLEVVESELGLWSYHLRVAPWVGADASGHPGGRERQRAEIERILGHDGGGAVRAAAAAAGFLVYCVGDPARDREVPVVEDLDSLGAPISYVDASGHKVEAPGLTLRDALVWHTEPEGLVRCSLDWQGRACVVLVMAPGAPSAARARQSDGGPVRRQAELTDGELAELWRVAGEASRMHGGFEDMRLNAGSYQNVAHLHLKVFIPEQCYLKVWQDSPIFRRLREARKSRSRS